MTQKHYLDQHQSTHQSTQINCIMMTFGGDDEVKMLLMNLLTVTQYCTHHILMRV